jgi:hypothetical protein
MDVHLYQVQQEDLLGIPIPEEKEPEVKSALADLLP